MRIILVLLIGIMLIGCHTYEGSVSAFKEGLSFINKLGLVALDIAEDLYEISGGLPSLTDFQQEEVE